MAVSHVPVPPAERVLTLPRGFRAGGIHCGIKAEKADLAMVVSSTPAAAAGTFTQNKTRAAPVILSETRLRAGRAQAVIINSGNANACTGAQGAADAAAMTKTAGDALGVSEDLVLVASTGVIGRPLPLEKITAGIPRLVAALGPDGMPAARAMMTTDAWPKTATAQVDLGDGVIAISGIAKGCGMIHPDMATMLAVITTDAAVEPAVLREALRAAVSRTFNCISVDGDTSTSDSVFLLANGASALAPIAQTGDRSQAFLAGLTDVAGRLARLIVQDGEGAERVIEIAVRGARSAAEARVIGRTVMTSLLVKTAFHGAELNWGRISAAVGRSGAEVNPELLSIAVGGIEIVRHGVGLPEAYADAQSLLTRPEVRITIGVGLGSGEFTGWTSDLGEAYVKFNAGYLT